MSESSELAESDMIDIEASLECKRIVLFRMKERLFAECCLAIWNSKVKWIKNANRNEHRKKDMGAQIPGM